MLLCAGTAARRADKLEEIRRLGVAVDWDALGEVLAWHRLLPLIALRLKESGVVTPSESFLLRAEEVVAHSRRGAAMDELLTIRVVTALEAAGIDAMPLKGSTLARALYGDPGYRLSSDIDVLVAADQLHAASAVIEGLGYQPPLGAVQRRRGLPILHLLHPHPEGLPSIELHWRIHWYEEDFAADMLSRATREGPMRRAQPVDEMAALLLFYARDGFAGVRPLTDIAQWYDRFGDSLEAAALDTVVERYPSLRAALTNATRIAERLIGLPAQRLLPSLPRVQGRLSRAERLSDWRLLGKEAQIRANMGLVDLLVTPAGGHGAFARRQLLLSPAVLKYRDPRLIGAGPIRITGYMLLHLARMLIRFGLALWGTRGKREWSPVPRSLEPLDGR